MEKLKTFTFRTHKIFKLKDFSVSPFAKLFFCYSDWNSEQTSDTF